MNIFHLSDTHGHHRQLHSLPGADILIHSGDITENGTIEEVIDFIEWLNDLPYKYKIFIPGNHDLVMHETTIEGLPNNIFCLMNSAIKLNNLTIYGLPLFMEDVKKGSYKRQITNIPSDVDVLISHEPPLGILDGIKSHKGNIDLLYKTYEIKPQIHLFGHIHESEGIEEIDGMTFSNASMSETNFINKTHLFEINI